MSKKDQTPPPEPEETKEEGPHGFAVLLQKIGDGTVHAELSEELQGMNAFLSELAENTRRDAKGTITLTVHLRASEGGTMTVHAEVKSKKPKVPARGSVFWLTKGNNLADSNPRQVPLPLREVPMPKVVKDLPTEDRAPRAL